MENILPRLRGGRVVRVAEDQPQYTPVSVVLATNPAYVAPPRLPERYNTVIMAFRLSEEERAAVAMGADFYLALLTFGGPQQPFLVGIGPEGMAETHGLEAVPEDRTAPTDMVQMAARLRATEAAVRVLLDYTELTGIGNQQLMSRDLAGLIDAARRYVRTWPDNGPKADILAALREDA